MLNVSRRGSRVSAYTRVSHSSDALLLVPSSGTRITQPFRPWDHDSLSLSVPPSLRYFPTFSTRLVTYIYIYINIYIYNIYTYVYVYIRERLYVCMPPLCSSLSLAVSVGRAARAFHLSFSLFFSVLDVLLGLVPTILEYVRYARLRLCFVDRGHTGKRYKEKKGIFLMILWIDPIIFVQPFSGDKEGLRYRRREIIDRTIREGIEIDERIKKKKNN